MFKLAQKSRFFKGSLPPVISRLAIRRAEFYNKTQKSVNIRERDEDMKKKLNIKETILVASMLFGMFFGAGNLIFPVSMGQLAGSSLWEAAAGFLITGVGLPLLGVAALGISRREGLLDLSSQTGRRFGIFFTCALYLTIGPFFAIPRCASMSFTVGIEGSLPPEIRTVSLAVFSLLFFALVLFWSLRPGEILTWIGKILNPLFLCFLGILVVRALSAPMGGVGSAAPSGGYAANAFAQGFLEGYNTMDALAGLAFGIIVVKTIRSLGIDDPAAVAASTVKAGIFSSLLMAAIYLLTAVVGAQSRGMLEASENGGIALAQIAVHYFGAAGTVILAVTVTVACLKTAVGLITSCGETFTQMFPNGPSYRMWASGFCVLSFLIANLGLNAIIAFSLPVLLFLYPLTIALILLTLTSGFWGGHAAVLRWTMGFTAAAAVLDFLNALPEGVCAALRLDAFLPSLTGFLPFFNAGFGWVCPALVGFAAGLVLSRRRR